MRCFRPLLFGLGVVLLSSVLRANPNGSLPPGPFDATNVFGEQRAEPQGFLPPIKPTVDIPMRDPSMMLGPDGFYYMVGTQPPDGSKNFWDPYNGIRLFRSADLKTWDNLGYVYTLKDNGTWQLTYQPGKLLPSFVPDQAHPKPTIWAPDLYYLKGTWWIAYALAYNGWGTCNGMLKSTSGKPTGPYVEVNTDGPIVDLIDPGLFQDNDGKVYYVWNNGKFAAMNDAMNQLAEKPRTAQPSNGDDVAFEGAALRQINGRYYMMAAGDGGMPRSYHEFSTYDTWVASADRVGGKYGPHYIAVRNGGHNVFFRDKQGNWWSTFFGWNPNNPFNEKPSMLRIQLDEHAHVQPYENEFTILSPDARVQGANWSFTSSSPAQDWAQPGFDDSKWVSAQGAFGANAVTDQPVPVRTLWTAPDIWMRRHFTLPKTNDPVPQVSLDIFHQGPTEVYINGVEVYTSTENEHYYRESNPLPPEAVKALVVGGDNVIAIHSTCGEQRIVDAGLRLFYHTEPIPVSTGKIATASSSADPAHGAAQAVDGSLDSAWIPAKTEASPSLVVDLGQAEDITRTDLYFDAPKAWHHYKIEYSSDQANWSIFYDSTDRLAVGDPCYTDVFDNGISADHVTGRYVRVTLADSQDPTQAAAVREFCVFGHPTEPNLDLALGKPVTASGSEDRFPAANVVDGYWGTKWRARGDGPRQLTVDLGTTQVVHCCKTWFSDPALAYRYQIETSPDNQAWTMFADRSANAAPSDPCSVDYAAASARYVRLTELGVNESIPIDVEDFKVYGESTSLPPPAPQLATAILGHWNLDETTGTTAADSSFARNEGTLAGSATWLPAGQIGGALDLHGGSLTVSHGPADAFTVAFWIRTTDKGATGAWKDGEPLVSSPGGDWGVSLVGDSLALGLGDRTLPGSQAINDGSWHECAVTRDSSGVGRVIVDGTCQITADGPATIAPATGSLVFGGGNFNGALDDIYLFAMPLNDIDLGIITALPAKLAGKWTFQEGTGEVAADSSGRSNDASFHGSPTWPADGVGSHSVAFADDSTYGEINRPVKDDFTLSMWIKTKQSEPDQPWNEGAWLVNGEMPGDTNDFGTSLSGGHFVFGTGAPDTTLPSKATINDGTWHHCVATRARLTGTLKVYIDGKLDGIQTAGKASLTAPSILRLGSTGANHFVGSLSDLEIYNGVLKDKEILSLYQTGRASLTDKPLAEQPSNNPHL